MLFPTPGELLLRWPAQESSPPASPWRNRGLPLADQSWPHWLLGTAAGSCPGLLKLIRAFLDLDQRVKAVYGLGFFFQQSQRRWIFVAGKQRSLDHGGKSAQRAEAIVNR